jgi:hypothetical protein
MNLAVRSLILPVGLVYSSFASNCTIDKQVQQQQRQREFKREKAVDSISQSVQLHLAFLPLFDLLVRILTMGVRPTLSARFSVIEGGWCSRVMVSISRIPKIPL